jgi:NAD(P)-dependent dehydrogenase (short-subunit alcohol dehydrogenase family)
MQNMPTQSQQMVNDTGLAGKVIIVTGGGAIGDGISNGRAACILCARAGAHVVVVGRNLRPAQRTVDMISAEGGVATAITGDVTNERDCQRIVEQTLARFGRLDGLDNNVGEAVPGTVVTMDMQTYHEYMALNVESQILMSRHAIPAMKATAGGGSIVNISSVSALRPKGNALIYSVAKGANISLTQAMAVDHAKDHIRVNCVVIGPVYTPAVQGQGLSEERRRQRANASLLKIEGTGWDTGHVVRFLLSDQARFVTGQAIVVDGGVTLVGPER